MNQGTSTASKNIEIELRGFLPREEDDLRHLFANLHSRFGQPYITDELVVFFKYNADMRLRFNSRGIEFILKNRVSPERKDMLKEYIVNIPTEEGEVFVRMLHAIGFEEGLFSFCTRRNYANSDVAFCLKVNSVCGDFYEIDKNIGAEDDSASIKEYLANYLSDLHLVPWTDQEYRDFTKASWSDVQKERLVDEAGQLHHKIREILAKYQNVRQLKAFPLQSISSTLKHTSNDYSHSESYFLSSTRHELLSHDLLPSYDNVFSKSLSIVIPVYNSYETLSLCLEAISQQSLTNDQFKKCQIIVVDDGSQAQALDQLMSLTSRPIIEKGVRFNFVRSMSNMGRAFARNLGLTVADGDIVLFMDADIVLDRNYIREIMIRHEYLDDIVLVGFKENVNINDPRITQKTLTNKVPEIKEDFRFEKLVKKSWTGIHPITEDQVVRCVTNSDAFKRFGHGRALGAWDLPCMVVTHNVSTARAAVEKIGRFNTEFGKLWGYEDTFFGASLIASGNMVVPLLSTGVFHIETIHEQTLGIRSQKQEDLQKSFQIYKKLIDQI